MHFKLPSKTNAVRKPNSELTRLMHQVIALAQKEGATDVAVAVNEDQGFSVDVRMGNVETVSFCEDKGLGLTVYFGHQKGTASSTDTSASAIELLVRSACDIAQASAKDPCFGLADKELLVNNPVDLDLYHPWGIKPQQAIDLALACENKALSMDKRIVNSNGVNVSTYEYLHAYANTHGAEYYERSTRHGISCSLMAKAGEEMRTDYDYSSVRKAADLVSPEILAQSVVERTLSRLGSRKIDTQVVPVLFSSRVSSGLFSSFIQAISGSNLYRKNSFLLDSIGQVVFPEFIKIHEQPYLVGALGSAAFDSEGVATRDNVFVEAGKVLQYVLGSYSARKLGLKTSANSDGVHNLTVDPSAGDLNALIKAMHRGFLVTELMGQGINLITGDYSRGACGFWVEDGAIQYPVDEVTVAGNLKEMFSQILAVGEDLDPNIATRCGSVLIEKMMVAGN